MLAVHRIVDRLIELWSLVNPLADRYAPEAIRRRVKRSEAVGKAAFERAMNLAAAARVHEQTVAQEARLRRDRAIAFSLQSVEAIKARIEELKEVV